MGGVLPRPGRAALLLWGWVSPAPCFSPDRPAQAPSLGLAGSHRGSHPGSPPSSQLFLLVREEQGTVQVLKLLCFTVLGRAGSMRFHCICISTEYSLEED